MVSAYTTLRYVHARGRKPYNLNNVNKGSLIITPTEYFK